jgi:hypothetical protein
LCLSIGIMWYLDISPSEFIYLLETFPNYIKHEMGLK